MAPRFACDLSGAKTIKRSAGRSSTAAAAYRAGERIECQREGRLHDYTAKRGIEETFILTPENAPSWAQDRAALWNAAEESETRRNSVTAREWELALPSEISAEDRSQITRQFAEELVSRYGVAVDVAIHAPHREGDQRNHHAHVLTTTRKLEPEGFTTKTRVLDSAKTGGVEIEQMRGVWAELQNLALERVGEVERVDHRSLEAQREEALSQGDTMKAEELDRDPEVKLGPAANAMERREMRAAEREGRDYEPVTERGRAVHATRQARALFAEMRERLELARDTYGAEREAGQGRVSAGLAALRAAASKDRGADRGGGDIRDRLARIVGREEPEVGGQSVEEPSDLRHVNERLRETLGRSEEVGLDEGDDGADKSSIRDRLEGVLNKPRETLESDVERNRDDEQEHERETDREVDRGEGHSL
ncbi:MULTISPECIES: MobQ family relaxase [unclassified Ruegeria]|uniref:MobQ family relaxase n=1 Tax=unclassified Ruegeria TaxID=2625375 RepID=UPI001268D22B|nr:MobQ family relaxase [Ruegeria sp. THAF33]QFT75759.1 Mobilization protein A [Ruegeria sp. THAF33]